MHCNYAIQLLTILYYTSKLKKGKNLTKTNPQQLQLSTILKKDTRLAENHSVYWHILHSYIQNEPTKPPQN